MDKIRIRGGRALSGKVRVGGAKNAALPILIASLLTDEECELSRVPALADIHSTDLLLKHLGVKTTHEGGGVWKLRSSKALGHEAPYDIVRKMRASFLVLGPLLARLGRARVSLPGGCAIGTRPINFHLQAFEKLGARIEIQNGYVVAQTTGLRGDRFKFPFPSVGATENALMAATLARGETVLENCAREPEIEDLALALRSMGALIEGAGTDTIRVQGVNSLGGMRHQVCGDRIEAGTFLCAALATRGSVEVEGIAPGMLEAVLEKLEEAGARVQRLPDAIQLESQGRARAVVITTQPYPGFPTDMQAQFVALASVVEGVSEITETIFENRLMHVPELCRLGADIQVRGNQVRVSGKESLVGAPVMATDLRASASLVLGGLVAQGETVVSRVYHLDRGYEGLETKFRALGADIERVG